MPVGNWAHGAQCRIIGEIHGQQTVNVMHFGTDLAAADQGTLDTILLQLANAMLTCVITTLLPATTSDWKVVKVDARRLFPAASDPVEATAPANSVGELSPAQVSFAASIVGLKSGVAGRRGRGRLFLPPPGEAEVAQSSIDGPTLALITAFLTCVGTQFMGATPDSDWHLGVWSRTASGGLFANFNTGFHLVASLSPRADLGVMRRRRKGTGS